MVAIGCNVSPPNVSSVGPIRASDSNLYKYLGKIRFFIKQYNAIIFSEMLGDEIDFSYATIDNIPLGSHDKISLCTKFKTPTLQPYNNYGVKCSHRMPMLSQLVQSSACWYP